MAQDTSYQEVSGLGLGSKIRKTFNCTQIERRRRRRGGAWGGGIPLPIRLGSLGERRELPSGVRGEAPAAGPRFLK